MTDPDHQGASESLTDAQREGLLADLRRDGYCVLPMTMPPGLLARCLEATDRIATRTRAEVRASGPTPVKVMNCVDVEPAFRELMLFTPALQLAYDTFGPMFHLCQSNVVSRPCDGKTTTDFLTSAPWHADGPRPGLFPSIDGAMGLHYLKFGYFFTDLRHGDGGALQVVRGSHLRAELDGAPHGGFDISSHAPDVVTFDCARGTIVAFHQAQWHAAPPNRSRIERKNAYISYCPTWMRPFDREPLRESDGGDLDPVTRWLLGEWRPAARWWLPSDADLQRLAPFARRSVRAPETTVRYE